MKTLKSMWLSVVLAGVFLPACSTAPTSGGQAVSSAGRWILLPSINNSETPQAGGRLDSITASLLMTYGITDISTYPATDQPSDSLFENADRRSQEAALAWAMKQGARYAVAGTVEEWRYKVGLDGQPAVGLTLNIIQLDTGKVVWTGSGARTGWGRESVSGVAHELVYSMLDRAIHHDY